MDEAKARGTKTRGFWIRRGGTALWRCVSLETSASCLSPQKRIARELEVFAFVGRREGRERESDRDDCIVTQRESESESARARERENLGTDCWIGEESSYRERGKERRGEERSLGESEG